MLSVFRNAQMFPLQRGVSDDDFYQSLSWNTSRPLPPTVMSSNREVRVCSFQMKQVAFAMGPCTRMTPVSVFPILAGLCNDVGRSEAMILMLLR